MTYVGELGWELTVPVELAAGVYDGLMAPARTWACADAGYYAIESLRLEKGYRAFGRELTPDYGPVEAGLVFATALKGDKDFLGRAALEAHRACGRGGPRRRLVSFVVDDPTRCSGAASCCSATARPAGQVTSAAWGETVGACVGLGYVRADGPVTSGWLDDGGRSRSTSRGSGTPCRATLRAPLA